MRVMIMAGFISTVLGLFGCGKRSGQYEVADVYTGLRDQIFSVEPKALGLSESESTGPVWAILMETGYSDAVVSLLAIADGTVSIYFSNGGGIIGLGEYDAPNRISKELLQVASDYLCDFEPSTERSLPSCKMTRFYLFTLDGRLVLEAKENDLGNNRHRVSPLFHKAHELITAIRIVDEERKTGQGASGGAS